MAKTILVGPFPVSNFTGTRAVPKTRITDDAATMAVLALDGSQMLDSAVQVVLATEESHDNGVTWINQQSATVNGGQHDKRGNVVLEYNCIHSLLPGAARDIRGSVVVPSAPLSTDVTAYTA